ncbi:MAG: hypothetical protein Q8N47_04935 [Bryobacterales bacterium]|nr:hypothetical protein [Bryobacterales bacterium]
MLFSVRAGALLALLTLQPAFGLSIIPHAKLTQATLAAFDNYVRGREALIERQIAECPFLWADQKPERMRRLQRAGMVVEPFAGSGAEIIGDGTVHDWLGTVFVPGVTLERTLAVLQNYDAHKVSFAPEVTDSKLRRRNGDFFQVYLRLRKHKFVTVVLNTNYDITYRRVSPTRAASRSYSTRIAEVEKPGTASEHELTPGDDHGFLWRMHSFWRFEERDGGVYVEFEAISLTRDVPRFVSAIVTPVVRQLPRESLEMTLLNLRRALNPASPR